MIRIVEGNLLDAKEHIIGHQVNCKFVMGAGLARQIRSRYPTVYETYLKAKGQSNLLGKVQMVHVNKHRVVANIFGQYNYGRDGLYTDYKALEEALTKTKKFAKENNLSVALPFGLGSGLAGGDWKTIYGIIDRAFDGYEVTLYKF
ncbi:Appr-1-p processing protein [Lederbergia citrisecunda]|uniref:macro domain-containing protein n=1 Tax=Lederbergia citrisecunda TaxID=2833583 RepID=UPI003D28AE94